MNNSFEDFIEGYNQALEQGRDFVIVTLVEIIGSAPQDVGARCIVDSNGLLFGTVGGGKVEKYAINKALEALEDSNAESFITKVNLQKDLGMNCGGAVQLFFEPKVLSQQWHIVIFGAGHVSQELCRVLLRLDCKITCIDPRKEWLDKLPTNSRLELIELNDMSSYVDKIKVNDYVCLMTMGSSVDFPILKRILEKEDLKIPYLGMIGSNIKRKNIEKQLLEHSIDKDKLTRFLCPIGDKIGSNAPAEMAISVCSELLRVRDFKKYK